MDQHFLEELTALVGDLVVGPGATADDLDTVRRAAAAAVVGGQRATRARSAVPDLGYDAHVLEPLLNEALAAPRTEFLVSRRALPIASTQPPDATPPWASGRAVERTIGPFLDRLGRPVWIDFYRPIQQVALVRTAGGAPFLLLSGSVARITGSQTDYKIGAGSVWIASRLIAAAAPSGAYTGLRVDGGKLRFSQPITISSHEVIVPPGVDCRLELNLHAESTPAGSGDGADARAAQAKTPDKVTIVVAGNNATFAAVADAQLQAYGTSAKLTCQPGPPEYLPDLKRIALPMHSEAATFKVKAVASRLFRPSGNAAITRAGWGLPVAVTAPASLGEASGAGTLLVWLDAGVRATWVRQLREAELGPSLLMVEPTRLTLVAASASTQGAQHRVSLWEGVAPNIALLRWGQAFILKFFAQAAGSEALWTRASLEATIDRPLDLNGQRLGLSARTADVIHLAWAQGVYIALFGALDDEVKGKRIALGIANSVFLTTPPWLCLFYVRLDSGPPTTGACLLAYTQRALLPTLPDPYAVNLGSLRRALDQGSSVLLSLVGWRPGQVRLDFILPTDAGTRLPAAPRPGLSWGGRDNSEMLIAAARASGDALDFERQGGVILLDVSTRSDQFGVALTSDVDRSPSLSVDELYLRAHDRDVVLLTLPAVQWEAVLTNEDPNDPTFPHRLGFANSGVPTLLNVRSVKLVRIQPQAALDQLVDNFAQSDPTPTTARFTLPFGMLAAAMLQKPTGSSPRGAEVAYNRPRKANLEGAHQLSIRAVDTSLPANASPSLPGYTLQLPVGQPGSRSVLGGAVTTTFNTYLGPTGFRPLVPVARLDLTGYGESLFSDWRNPYTDPVAVSQARFDVLVGRTSYEVVQVRSYLYPYAVQVVRTITIERKNSAVITRRDSGWQAVSDGTYHFPGSPQVETHPGVVRRITKVSGIRDTGQVLTLDGIELAAVRFDGDLELDGAPALVPARDQLGFVQLTAGNLMPATTYQKLVESAGALGGAIDTNLQVGSGRQRMRISRVGVGVTKGMGGPEFVMTAWGSPGFPGGGQWSFLKLPGPTEAPIAVPRDGVPLIRAGVASAGSPPLSSPYRFADPVDLAQPDTPDSDYGILHATGTQRAFFARPKIEASSANRIISTQVPVVADPYTLATALGLFPEVPKTIPFPSSNWSFEIDGTGNYRLVIPANPFPVTVGRRTLRQAGSVSGDVDYTGATLRYEIDTAQAVAWHFALDGASKVMNSTALGDVMRLGANVRASADAPTVFDQPNMKLGGGLTVVQDLLTILQDLGITGIMSAEMTNEWSIKVSVKIPFVDAKGEELQIPPKPADGDIIFADSGCSVEVKVWPAADELEFKLGGQPMFAIKSYPGLYVVAIIEFGIKISTESGTTYSLTLGVGIAYQKDVGIFSFKGMFGLTIFGFVGDNVLGWGMGFMLVLSAEISFIISVEIKLEGKLAMLSACRGTPDETLFGVAKLTFAIEVTVFLIFSISFEYETTSSEVLTGPGEPACMLPDVVP